MKCDETESILVSLPLWAGLSQIANKRPSSGLSAVAGPLSHAKMHGRRPILSAFSRLLLQMGEGARRADEGSSIPYAIALPQGGGRLSECTDNHSALAEQLALGNMRLIVWSMPKRAAAAACPAARWYGAGRPTGAFRNSGLAIDGSPTAAATGLLPRFRFPRQ